MDSPQKPTSSLFDVYLRLRPAARHDAAPRFIDVESIDAAAEDQFPKHITVLPPTEIRKRAVEKYAFTRVFEEQCTQLEVFTSTGVGSLVGGVLGRNGSHGRDGMVATLGVTGSGKTHTILGSKTQRGITQMTLDLLYKSISSNETQQNHLAPSFASLAAEDVSEAQLVPATVLLESLYGDGQFMGGRYSRAQTPMMVCSPPSELTKIPHSPSIRVVGPSTETLAQQYKSAVQEHLIGLPGSYPEESRESTPIPMLKVVQDQRSQPTTRWEFPCTQSIPQFSALTRSKIAKLKPLPLKDTSYLSLPPMASAGNTYSRQRIPRPSALPRTPDIDSLIVPTDPNAEYAVVISMYEVYNDRIYDLLAAPSNGNNKSPGPNSAAKRRPLLFKSTEGSPERKVVAGLRKVVCGDYDEAIQVLEMGLLERKVTGTGSNAVSSRSHGFFCVEVRKRDRVTRGPWSSSTLTIVDLAGSERARVANTAGATLVEAGKINSSLMYLGQCMQMQSDNQDGSKNIVPFRQCKLTELLFSNSFPSSAPSSLAPFAANPSTHHHRNRNPQKAIMIVTADPVGDFNATSQILRYSALAREAVIPRIPSVSSQIMAATYANPSRTLAASRPGSSHQSLAVTYPTLSIDQSSPTQEEYLSTITTLTEERDIALLSVAEERQRADTLEAFIASVDDRWELREAELREECFAEMEGMVEREKRRWKAAWEEEADAADERLDAKIEIVTRTSSQALKFAIHEDDGVEEPTAKRVLELEEEVAALKARLGHLDSEALLASPTKKQRTSKTNAVVARGTFSPPAVKSIAQLAGGRSFVDLQNENAGLRRELEEVVKKVGAGATPMRSPSKKMRVLKSKKWEVELDGGRDSID